MSRFSTLRAKILILNSAAILLAMVTLATLLTISVRNTIQHDMQTRLEMALNVLSFGLNPNTAPPDRR